MKRRSLALRRMGLLAAAWLSLTGAYSASAQVFNTNFQVTITAPTNGSFFTTPANVQIEALTYDTAEDVGAVAFTARPGGGGPTPQYVLDLGTASNGVVVGPPSLHEKLFTLVWTNTPLGTWELMAVAFSSNAPETQAAAPPVIFTVVSNLSPVARITSPPNDSVFRAPVNIALLAYANDPEGNVLSVQFFAGSNSLGFGLPIPWAGPGPVRPNLPSPIGPPIFLTNLYELIWSNAPAGSYALSAVVTGNTGLSATSAPVNLTVRPPPPPPTTKLEVVSIVATDPIAIDGTNCWRWPGLANSNAPPTWSNWVSPTALWRWFTNCGPKDATFGVYRAGATNNDLTVTYSIGGTASDGINYAALPGVVTIPAGQTEALITIIPMDGQSNNFAETVILSVDPSTNNPPAYVPDFPCRAEVIIIDSGSPPPGLTGTLLGGPSFLLSAQGPDGAWFRIDATADCIHWNPLCTNQVVNGSINFADPDSANFPLRLYRAVPLAGPPPN